MNNIPLTLFLALTFTWTPSNAAENKADALAKTILEKSGGRATICEMPRAGDGALAAALARAGVAQVHALAPDTKAPEPAANPSAIHPFHYSGVVCDQTANPKAGVKVAVIGANQVAVTDANGAFDVQGNALAEADKDGFRTESEVFPLIELSADKFEPITFRPDSLTQTNLTLTIWAFTEPKEGEPVDQARWAYIYRRGFPGSSFEATLLLPTDHDWITGGSNGYNNDWWGGCKGAGDEIAGLMWEQPKYITSTKIEYVAGTGPIPKDGEMAEVLHYYASGNDHWWSKQSIIATPGRLKVAARLTAESKPPLSLIFTALPASDRIMFFHKGPAFSNDPKAMAAASYKDVARFTIHAYDNETWMKPLDIDIEWGFQSGSQSQTWDGYIESHQGYVTDVQPLGIAAGGVAMTGERHWKDQPGLAQRRGIRARVWQATNSGGEMKNMASGDPTLVTLWTKAGSVSFAPADLEKGPILIPRVGIYVTKRDGGKTAAEFQKQLAASGQKTIRQRVREHRELDYQTAMKARFKDKALPPIPAPPADAVPPGMEIDVPEPEINALWRLGAAHLQLATHKQPDGTYLPSICAVGKASLAAESYAMIRAYDLMGLPQFAEGCLNYWFQSSRPVEPKGNICMRDTYNGHPIGHGYMQNTAWFHYLLTRNLDWAKKITPELIASYDWSQKIRLDYSGNYPRGTKNYRLVPQWILDCDAGSMPPYYCSDYTFYFGNAAVANLVALTDPERAAVMKRETEEYRQDIRRAVCRSVALSSVTKVDDGTYRGYLTIGPYFRGIHKGRYLETSGNSVDGCKKGVFDVQEPIIQDTLDVLEDLLLEGSSNAKDKESWFDHAGYNAQCGNEPQSYVLAQDGDAPLVIRNMYTAFVADVAPWGYLQSGPYTLTEHPDGRGMQNKTFETGAFLERVRTLLVWEDGDSLCLARFAPRAWLEQGKKISVKNSPTFFGPVAYEINSDITHGKITASVTMPTRNPPTDVRLSLRHPKSAPIKSVTVNGKPWKDFDPANEVVRLHDVTGLVKVEATYGQ